MGKLTVKRFFAEVVRGYGITHVFYVPAILRNALAEMEDMGITRVTTHHEISAVYMADGYARASRKPGICMAQSVGAANMAAGLREPFLSCSPVIAITGGPHPESRYRYVYQGIEDFHMFEAVTKFNARVEKPERLTDLLRQAFRVATTGAPGPAHLEVPGASGEEMAEEGDLELIVEEQFGRVPPYRPEPEMSRVRDVAALLATAQRPVIVAGRGVIVSDAARELAELAEKLSIPVVTSLHGKEILSAEHPLSVGVSGRYSRWCANRILSEADMVFFVGSRAGSLVTNSWKFPPRGTPVLQLDIDPEEIGRNYPVKAGVVGDAKVTLRRLIAAVEPAARSAWVARAQGLLREWWAEMAAMTNSDAVPIRPERICKEITDFLQENAVLVTDTGHSAIWSGTLVGLKRPGQRYIRCSGTLGWGFPASLGVKCALPDRPVLCFSGDGGFYYHMAELETAARLGINVVVLVNNNGSLAQEKRGFDSAYGGNQRGKARQMWVFKQTDFAAVAEAMGCLGIRVERPNQIRPALEQAFAANRPVVIDVRSDIEAQGPPTRG
jgi:acetolactate synthase-1/2/3 large subunit